MIKVLVISAAVVAAVPCYAQEVRVFSGDGIEHVYGPGGEVLDSRQLTAKDHRAREMRSHQRGADNDAARRQPPKGAWKGYVPPTSAWSNNGYVSPDSAWSSNGYQPPRSAWGQ
jgi:hypothetical protein